MTTTHRQTTDGTSGTALDGAVVLIHIIHNIHEAGGNGSSCRFLWSITTATETWGVHAERPLARSRLTVGVAVGHHHNHRLGLTSCYQIVENLSGTTEFTPCVLVTARAMKQIHDRITATLVVARGRIDGHTALHLQRGAWIPHLREVAVRHLIHAVEVALVTLLGADDKNVGKRYYVTIHIDVGRVLDARHAVDIEGVAVHFRSQLVGGVAPHAVLAFHKLGNARSIISAVALDFHLLCGQEIASYLDLHSLRGVEIECHRAVTVDDGRLHTSTIEEFFLCLCTHTT